MPYQLVSKFKKGSKVYKCESCGKMTRDTGRGEIEDRGFGGTCAKCYDEGGYENEHQDYGSDHNGAGPMPDECPMCRPDYKNEY